MRLKFIALAATAFLLAGCASPEAEPATTSATTQTSQQEQATDEASADPQQMDAAESMDYETPEETQQADSSETDSAGESEQEDKEQDSSPKEPEAEETEAEEPEALETEEPTAEPVATETPAAEPAGFTMAMISENNTASKCWVAIDGMAYDLTAWITSHPGGQGAITGLCGKDGTAMFLSRHGGQANPDRTLDMYVLGPITG